MQKHNAFCFLYHRLTNTLLPSNTSLSIQVMLSAFHLYTHQSTKTRKTRHNLSHHIGFASNISQPCKLKVIHLTKQLSEYPPLKHIIYERKNSKPEPYSKDDPTCGHTSQYHELNPTQLSYDLPANESAIFYDPYEKKIIAVVIRDFAQSSFPFIKDWGVDLIRKDMPRRRKEQRNGPGHLAMFAASSGARSKRKIGWVANLLSKVYERSTE